MKNKIKVAIGSQATSGPWGGGSAFVRSLSNGLLKAGHCVVYDLKSNDIDIILLTDPRRIKNITFGPGCAYRYLLFNNPNAIVVHRINECDERKNTYFINRLLKRANYIADHTVFISEWLKTLPLWHNIKDFSIIRNGADSNLFFPSNNISWNKEKPLKLVTHHWSNNMNKGYQMYYDLWFYLKKTKNYEFVFIGQNVPEMFKDVWSDEPISTWFSNRFFNYVLECRFDRFFVKNVEIIEKHKITNLFSDHDILYVDVL